MENDINNAGHAESVFTTKGENPYARAAFDTLGHPQFLKTVILPGGDVTCISHDSYGESGHTQISLNN